MCVLHTVVYMFQQPRQVPWGPRAGPTEGQVYGRSYQVNGNIASDDDGDDSHIINGTGGGGGKMVKKVLTIMSC